MILLFTLGGTEWIVLILLGVIILFFIIKPFINGLNDSKKSVASNIKNNIVYSDSLNLNKFSKNSTIEVKEKVDRWLEMIAEAQVDKVLKESLSFTKESNAKEYMTDLVSLSSRFRYVNESHQKGILKDEDVFQENVKINDSLIHILNRMSNS